MNPQPAITNAAALIADPARAAMLLMLVDGRARPAGELAYGAGVSAQTASSHLAKLLAGGLLGVEREGRHRYYRLAGPEVASLLKHLASVGPAEPPRRKAPNRNMEHLRFARCCYDHLAGSLGVGITKAMLSRGYIADGEGKAFAITPGGTDWFSRFGIGYYPDHAGPSWPRPQVPRLDRARASSRGPTWDAVSGAGLHARMVSAPALHARR